MQHLVTLVPSGKTFSVFGNESILESGLRGGVDLDYGCSNGNCGLCKARLVSGDVEKIRHFDFTFRAADERPILLCSYTARSDLTIETRLPGGVADIPLQTIDARVNKIEALTDRILSLRLQTPRTKRLRFLAGQGAHLSTARLAAERFPIASCPCDDRNIVFHIDRLTDSPFTAAVDAGLKKNDMVCLRGPVGSFVLEPDIGGPLRFFALDNGFAPIKSLIEQTLQIEYADSIDLYRIVSHEENLYLDNLLRSWADAFDNFSYTPLPLDEGPPTSSPVDALNAVLKRITLPHTGDPGRAYIAGPHPAVTAVAEWLQDLGIPPDCIKTETVD